MKTSLRAIVWRGRGPILVGALVFLGGAAQAETAKLDASLSLLKALGSVTAETSLPSGSVKRTATSPAMVAVTIRFSGDPFPQLAALGVKVGSVSGPVATAHIPLDKLSQVAAVPGVVFIEAAKTMVPKLSLSVPATGASTLRTGSPLQWTGATGAGVVLGVVDDGLDFRHPDFLRGDGTTRLLGLWDMRDAALGTPPAGFSYGAECTPVLLNQAISSVNSTACTQPSNGNHGTHVGGIAAGNGQATGEGQAAFRFVGMAPLADIVVANAIGAGVSASNAVIDGVNYIKRLARAAGKPAVINLSLGSYYGNRDGTSNYETALTAAGEAGVVIVGAAGNEGNVPIRAEADLAVGSTVSVAYRVPGADARRVEAWYPGTHEWSVKVVSDNGQCESASVAADTAAYHADTPCGAISISNNAPSPLNDDRQMLVQFGTASGGQSPAGLWHIKVTSVRGAGKLSMVGGEDANGGVFESHTSPVTSQILTDTCSATGTICVGAYVTRTQWNMLGGAQTTETSNGAIGALASFSSRGPRRNCSNLSKCPPAQKPEITAPGAMIISALGQDAVENDRTRIEADGRRVAYNGTSMATPHVAGAIALLLQKSPQLTPADVRNLLLSNVKSTPFTPALVAYDPNVAAPTGVDIGWGYGVLDVARAHDALGSSPGSNIVSTASGTSSSLKLDVRVIPKAAELNTQLQVFVVAVVPGGLIFVNEGGTWRQFTGQTPAPFQEVLATTAIELQLFNGLSYAGTPLVGTSVFVGYGKNWQQMVADSSFKLVHTLAP